MKNLRKGDKIYNSGTVVALIKIVAEKN